MNVPSSNPIDMVPSNDGDKDPVAWAFIFLFVLLDFVILLDVVGDAYLEQVFHLCFNILLLISYLISFVDVVSGWCICLHLCLYYELWSARSNVEPFHLVVLLLGVKFAIS